MKILAPYKPTPQLVVDNMLRLAKLRKDDVLYDLGCGDGRILITAAKRYGARCVGVDVDPKRVEESIMNVKKAGVQDLVTIREQDAMTVDLSDASVVALYLMPYGNVEIQYRLWQQLKVSSRVVSHDYWMEDWKPLRLQVVKEPDAEHLIYLWQIEEKHKEIDFAY